MIELKKGVYSLDGFVETDESPIVAVHPTFRSHLGCYVKNLKSFMKSYDGPIITLDGFDTFDETVRTVGELHAHNRFFIKTLPSGPVPTEISSQEMYDFIKSFKGRPISLMGVYWSGCVSVVRDKLLCLGESAKILKGLSYDGFGRIYGSSERL